MPTGGVLICWEPGVVCQGEPDDPCRLDYAPRGSTSPGSYSTRPSMPPDTVRTCPLTCPDRLLDARYTIAIATSWTRPTFRIGTVCKTRCSRSGSDESPDSGVSVQPGATTLTRPRGASRQISFFSDRANP